MPIKSWPRRILSAAGRRGVTPRPAPLESRRLGLEVFEDRTLPSALGLGEVVLQQIYGAQAEKTRLVRINRETGEQKVIPMGASVSERVAIGADMAAYAIRVGSPLAGPKLIRVDLASGKQSTVLTSAVDDVRDMDATADGRLLFLKGNSTLEWLDPVSHVEKTLPLPRPAHQVAPAEDGTVYALTGKVVAGGGYGFDVWQFDPATGGSSTIGSGPGLAGDIDVARDGTAFVTVFADPGTTEQPHTVIRVERATGVATPIDIGNTRAGLFNLPDVAVGQDGALYVVRQADGQNSWMGHSVYRVDPATGASSPVPGGSGFANFACTNIQMLPSRLLIQQPRPQATGDLKFTYRVTAPVVNEDVPIRLYWATGADKVVDLEDPLFPAPDDAAGELLMTVKAGTPFGSKVITVPKVRLLTAPPDATALTIISDPDHMRLPGGADNPEWVGDRADIQFSSDPLTVALLRKAMPRLSATDAARYVEALNQAMAGFGITAPERRAAFLGQLAHESAQLSTWSEKYNGPSADAYFINKYWLRRGQWTDLGLSAPTVTGILLRIPHSAGPAKPYQLYWAKGSKLANSVSLIGEVSFTYAGGTYNALFAGAGPDALPAYTTHLLVVDPSTGEVVSAIHNNLGNWSPQDATRFRGRGPIQLTGRYNYQKFADSGFAPSGLMANPDILADKENNPGVGLQAAGWFWQLRNGRDLNDLVDSFEGQPSADMNRAVTLGVNGGANGLLDRLAKYYLGRSALLIPPKPGAPNME